jgi:hypothetical protein
VYGADIKENKSRTSQKNMLLNQNKAVQSEVALCIDLAVGTPFTPQKQLVDY